MITAYHQPRALDEALALVARGAVPLAGATGLYTGKPRRDTAYVDITRCGLGAVEVAQDRLVFGATATLTRILDADLPGHEGALVKKGAASVSSRPMRNAITIGGNLTHVAFWADMPVVLLALDAQVEVTRPGGAVSVLALSDFLSQGTRAFDGGLVTRVFVPRRAGTRGFGHERFSRTSNDYAFATACAALRKENGRAFEVHLVLGALQPRAFRATAVEQMLEGRPLDDALLAEAGRKVSETVPVAPNFRAPAEYRRELAGVLSRRALAAAFAQAKEA